MSQNEINNLRTRVHQLIGQAKINDAIEVLRSLVEQANQWDLNEKLQQTAMSYQLMLQYLSQGIDDPKRNEVLAHIKESLHLLADQSAIALLEPQATQVFFTRRRELADKSLEVFINDYLVERNKYDLLTGVPHDQRDEQAILNTLKQCELRETDIFNKVWSDFPTSKEDFNLITEKISDSTLPAHAKSLIISALLLGLMMFYDERKLLLLIDAYSLSDDTMVQMRALISTLITLKLHNERTRNALAISSKLKGMTGNPHFKTDVASALFLLARSRNTENISRRIQEDIIPDIMKMRGDIMRKMRETDNNIDPTDFESNPEWQEMLENSGMSKKFEQFNEMQLDGSDVLISTFSRLKTFPFFRTLSNWFLPYHRQHSLIASAFNQQENALKALVEHAPFMCDSDRYSFCLSLSSVPESQRQLMMGQIGEQNLEMLESEKEELPNPQKDREKCANAYIQDLYRFFKLFTRRREFAPAFDSDMDFTKHEALKPFVTEPKTLQLIAEYYFKNAMYADAIKYFGYLLENTDEIDPHIYQKRGFAHQNMGHLNDALEDYKRYELACDSDLWTIKHIASCHRALKQYDLAMEQYQRIDAIKPNNVANTLNMGHCLLEQGLPEQALKYYFKVDFMDDNKHKAWRPIAWCSFLEGNDTRSMEYYDKILQEDKPTAQDYLNRGHVALCMRQTEEAMKCYKQSLALIKGNRDTFREMLAADLPHLTARGLDTDFIWLIADSVCAEDNN